MAPDDDGRGRGERAPAVADGVGDSVGDGGRLGDDAVAPGRSAFGLPPDVSRTLAPRDDTSVTAKGMATRTATATFTSPSRGSGRCVPSTVTADAGRPADGCGERTASGENAPVPGGVLTRGSTEA
jgi:hypothetical protein